VIKKRLYFVLIFSLFFKLLFSQCTDNWAKHVGANNGSVFVNKIKKDSKNNTFIAGVIGNGNGLAFFDTIAISQKINRRYIFLAKYDSTEKVIWVKKFAPAIAHLSVGMDIDDKDNLYITGRFNDTAFFDTITLISQGQYNGFVAKINNNGDIKWVKEISSSIYASGNAIYSDKSTGVFFTGIYNSTMEIDTFQLSNTSNIVTTFIGRVDTLGNIIWIKSSLGSGNAFGQDIQGSNNMLYVTGDFEKDISFNGVQFNNSNGFTDIFIVKFDSEGNLLWLKSAGGTDSEYARSMSVDSNSDIYITGTFWAIAQFDTFFIQSNGLGDVFLVKYNKDGIVNWVKNAGGNDGDGGYQIAIKNESLYLTGLFRQNAQFADTVLNSNGKEDVFWAKYNTLQGEFICVRSAGGMYDDQGKAIYVDYNVLLLAGNYGNDNIELDGVILPACNSCSNVFFGKTCLPCDSTGNPEDVYETIQEQSSFTIYPNPNNGNFELRILNDALMHTKSEISIYNTIGQEVYHVLLKNTTTQLNLTALARGFYYVKFGGEVQKMVISY
jgi:hypothetical protein